MRRIRCNVAVSLDGYIADTHGGFDWIPRDATVDFAALFARVDTILLGGRSYDTVDRKAHHRGSLALVYVISRHYLRAHRTARPSCAMIR